MSIHTHFGWGALTGLVFTLYAPAAHAVDETADLSAGDAVALALAAHPRIRQADADLLTARAARSSSAVFLNNPSLSGWVTLDGERTSLNASQPLSITGEGWHARAAASHDVTRAELQLGRTRRQVAAQTRLAWVEVSVATGQVEVAQEGAALAERLEYGVSRKYEEGEASALDLRLASLSQVQATVRLLEARRTQASALRELTGWTLIESRPQDIPSNPLVAAPVPSSDPGTERADVLAAQEALKEARAQLSRQRAAAVPPVSLGVGLDVESGALFAGPTIGLSVPLFDRNQGGRAAAVGSLAVRESELAALTATAATELQTARLRVQEAEQATALLDGDPLVEARLALASIEAGVLAGEIDLSTAVLLQTQVLNGETAVVSLRGLVAAAQIDLLLALDDDALVGGAP